MTGLATNYVVFRRSGAIFHVDDGRGGRGAESPGPYYAILAEIARLPEAHDASDPPDKLLLNGNVVVEGGLMAAARAYKRDMAEATEYAVREVSRLHQHRWMPDHEKTGSTPPGVDKWEVKRAKP
jgi:post-segregation antitoxin (ccd killing protein)